MLQWSFWEDFKEYVYATNIDTFEIVYMNAHFRRALGLENNESYVGKKCYKIIQGRDEPCPFCTNSVLQQGQFYEWVFTNPKLNQTKLLRDTLLVDGKNRYRLEITSDPHTEATDNTEKHFRFHSNTLLHSCISKICSCSSPEEVLQELVTFCGEKCNGQLSFLLEKQPEQSFSPKYIWSSSEFSSSREILVPLFHSVWQEWIDVLSKNQPVVLSDMDALAFSKPEIYATLRMQGIFSGILIPILSKENSVEAILGVGNLPAQHASPATYFLLTLVHLMQAMLQQRKFVTHLRELSYHDQLTGALNRNAFLEFVAKPQNFSSLGVIFCDITGLKKANDYFGHSAGDKLILHFYQMIAGIFSSEYVYRTGGDEFIVICYNLSLDDFSSKWALLRELVQQDENHLAIGFSWTETTPIDISHQVSIADQNMYQDKHNYYCAYTPHSPKELSVPRINNSSLPNLSTKFAQYLSENHFDTEALIDSISSGKNSCYLYFGDLQTNIFYISDNMKEDFGFQNNLVLNLLKVWERCIANEVDLKIYRDDLQSILSEKRTFHNLRYQVKDKDGKVFWIHCRGTLKWNEDKSAPIFFSGYVSRQESEFIVDSITNFPREFAALNKLSELSKEDYQYTIVAFAFNHFTEINESHGRSTADLLLRETANALTQYFQSDISFFRLDGLRFMGIIQPHYQKSVHEVVQKLKSIIRDEYFYQNILVKNPCSVGVMFFPRDAETPEEFLVNLSSLLSLSKSSATQEYLVHSPLQVQKQKQQAQLALELNKDILNHFHNFRVVIQPIVDAQTGKVMGGETLLRWQFEGKDISPSVFVPILEKNKLIDTVGKWIFEQVVIHCKRILSHQKNIYLSFNVSYFQVVEEDFISYMRNILQKYKLDGNHLVMELTETHFDDYPQILENFIKDCRELGMVVALDDFGNGYSSLGMLLKYSTEIVKLDRSLLHEMSKSKDKEKFIKSIVYACHQFNKKVCMEGIETVEELEMIRATGCNLIQGYYFYKPLEISDFYSLLLDT